MPKMDAGGKLAKEKSPVGFHQRGFGFGLRNCLSR